MSLFFSSGPAAPQYTGLQISTSSSTIPVPICYGSPLVPTNVIAAQNFGPAASSKKSTKGGASTTNYSVDVVLALGEFPGIEPPSSALALRLDGLYYPIGQPPRQTYSTFDFFNVNGPPYGFPEGNPGANGRPYPGIVLFQSHNLMAGSAAVVPQMEILLFRKYQGTCPLNNDPVGGFEDADPAICIVDYLTHPRYGAGFPASLLDTALGGSILSGTGSTSPPGDSALQTYCQAAVGLGFSLCLRNAEQASSVLKRHAKLLSAAVVWTGLLLKIIPYWDSPSSLNPGYSSASGLPLRYFNPNVQPIIDLDDKTILQTKDRTDPIEIERVDPADVKNHVRVSFKDRMNEYNTNIAEVKDENAIEIGDLFGPFLRTEEIQAGEEFTLQFYAQQSAQINLIRNVNIRNRGKFSTGWDLAYLEPMDIVTITDANLGLSRYPVRITSVVEKDDLTLDFEFEEFPVGAASPALYSGQGSNNAGFNTNAIPNPVNPPIIFNVPSSLGTNQIGFALSGGTVVTTATSAATTSGAVLHFASVPASVIVGMGVLDLTTSGVIPLGVTVTHVTATSVTLSSSVTGAGVAIGDQIQFAKSDPNWGGCEIWKSYDGVNYSQVGTQSGASTVGYLAAGLPAFSGTNPDAADTLSVSLAESLGVMAGVSATAAAAEQNRCVIKSPSGSPEFLSVETVALVGNNVYNLTNLWRGLDGSTGATHALGDQFALYSSCFILSIPSTDIGRTLHFKFLSFNSFGQSLQTLSGAMAYAFVP